MDIVSPCFVPTFTTGPECIFSTRVLGRRLPAGPAGAARGLAPGVCSVSPGTRHARPLVATAGTHSPPALASSEETAVSPTSETQSELIRMTRVTRVMG